MKISKTHLFSIFFPRKGTFTDAGDGDGGGGATNRKNSQQTILNTFLLYCFPPEANFD